MDWSLAAPTAVGVAVILAASLVPGALRLRVALAVALILGSACALALLDGVVMRRRTAAGRALARTVRLGEDHHGVIERVRGLELRGRPRFSRDVALRCLAEAGRCRRMDGRLRGAVARWLREAREEVGKGRGR